MTVVTLPWDLHSVLTAVNQCQQVSSAVRRRLLVRQSLHLHMYLAKQQKRYAIEQ